MIPSQMLKGTLEGCILKVISQKETYGYEISENLRTVLQIFQKGQSTRSCFSLRKTV